VTGLTNYPRRDIETHRFVARWNARFAGLVVLGGVYTEAVGALEVSYAAVLATAALMYAVSLSMRIQALRWGTDIYA